MSNLTWKVACSQALDNNGHRRAEQSYAVVMVTLLLVNSDLIESEEKPAQSLQNFTSLAIFIWQTLLHFFFFFEKLGVDSKEIVTMAENVLWLLNPAFPSNTISGSYNTGPSEKPWHTFLCVFLCKNAHDCIDNSIYCTKWHGYLPLAKTHILFTLQYVLQALIWVGVELYRRIHVYFDIIL